VEQAWRFLLGVCGVILCTVNAEKFGVWTLELHYATCNCASRLIVCNFCLLFNMVGVVDGCIHIVIANGQSLLRLGFNSPISA
jgi:hypothetical protein